MAKKQKRTISKGVEKMLEKARIKAPKTAADWRELEWRLAAAEAKEDALCGSTHSDTVSPDYSKDAYAALLIAEKEVTDLRSVILGTPAFDLRALRFKVETFNPDFDDWEPLKAELLATLGTGGLLTMFPEKVSPQDRPQA